jgi:hypothetical protein
MKPGFALSLSAEGVVLLHRAAGGWRNVGIAPLDSADLTAELAALRAKGEALEASGTCKLIIPNDQIRYLTIETGISDLESRRRMARAALEGATPYSVDDLVFDLSEEGSQTHIAAVAQETLAEAEAFALDNGFTPASFVAVPGDLGFLGEPFFGPAPSLGTTLVEPDGIAVVDVGPAEPPSPATAPDTETKAPKTRAAPEAGHTLTQDAALTLPKAPAASEQAGDNADLIAVDATEELSEESGPIQGFSSRRRRGPALADTPDQDASPARTGAQSPAQSSANRRAEKRAAPAPSASKTVPVSSTHSKIRSGEASASSEEHGIATLPPAAGSATAELTAARAATQTNTANAIAAVKGSDKASAASSTHVSSAPVSSAPVSSAPVSSAPVSSTPVSSTPVGGASPRSADPASAHPKITTISEAGAQASNSLTAGATKGKPRHLGLMLTAVLLLVMAAVAAFALLSEGGLFFSSERPPQERLHDGAIGESPAPAERPLPQETAPPLPAAPQQADDSGDVATEPAPPFEPLAPILLSETETEPVSIAPQVSAIPDQPDPGVIELSEQAQPDAAAALETQTELDASTAQPVLDTFEGSPTEARQLYEQETSTALSEAALYAATGIWQQVPGIAEAPALISLDEIYIASIDNSDLSQDAVALPAAPEVAQDPEPDTLSSPVSVGRDFTLDSRGLVVATSEGTLNPDGVMVYLGRPAVVPPATPERGEPAIAAAEAENARLASLSRKRPKLRPSDLMERAERALLGGLSRAELASVRPRARPASLKTEEQENQPVSALAIATSKSPRARPSNFANLVDRAQRRQTSVPATAAAAVAVAPVTVAPSLPSSASVARQATVTNAINLRNINLIGVSGKPSDRQALIRMPTGRYRKVRVGDRIDGGTVVAIGNSQLQYQKRGTNTTLKLPGD